MFVCGAELVCFSLAHRPVLALFRFAACCTMSLLAVVCDISSTRPFVPPPRPAPPVSVVLLLLLLLLLFLLMTMLLLLLLLLLQEWGLLTAVDVDHGKIQHFVKGSSGDEFLFDGFTSFALDDDGKNLRGLTPHVTGKWWMLLRQRRRWRRRRWWCWCWCWCWLLLLTAAAAAAAVGLGVGGSCERRPSFNLSVRLAARPSMRLLITKSALIAGRGWLLRRRLFPVRYPERGLGRL